MSQLSSTTIDDQLLTVVMPNGLTLPVEDAINLSVDPTAVAKM